ncbi:MAG: hypothetical protein JSW34_11950, partial [Candidatus Zixiibacteriota bacterium]
GAAIAVDCWGCAYVTGDTYSTDFPTVVPYQTGQGDQDAYVTKLLEFCCQIRGDIDHNGQLDVLDVTYFVDWLWQGGDDPVCMEEADVDGNYQVDTLDLIYLVTYFWQGGPPPVPCP